MRINTQLTGEYADDYREAPYVVERWETQEHTYAVFDVDGEFVTNAYIWEDGTIVTWDWIPVDDREEVTAALEETRDSQ